jgi:hypothetical protein
MVNDKRVTERFLGDPVFSGQSNIVIFKTVKFVNGR